jgi:Zn-dependent peptidase ImmA (M78 family)/transcriptional regulator with XRE-family HTH domain
VTDGSFEPARLRMARELREWTQADLARRLDVTPAAASQFESGVTRPGPEMMRKLASVLAVPPDFLRLPVVETHEGFFRSLRRTSVSHRRRARAIAQLAHDATLAAEPGELPTVSIPHIPVSDLQAGPDELEDVASQARQRLGLGRGPVRNVVQTIEDHGIVVIRLPLDTADVDAFSLPFPDRPVVVLSADKHDRARSRFDAAHELAHLVVHGEQIWGVKEVEQQAHYFAAAFLMPADDIAEELPNRPDWPVLFDLKRKWQVSLAALLMRARVLGRMSQSNYLTAVKAVSARGWRRVEPVPLGPPELPTHLRRLLTDAAGQRAASALPADVLEGLLRATSAEYTRRPELN